MKMTARELPRSYWRKVAEKNGICREVFNLRIKRGWGFERSATQPLRKIKKQADSASTLCREAGLPARAVYDFRRRNPAKAECMTDAEIVALVLKRKERPSTHSLAKQSGINPATVWSRLQRGLSLEKALTQPVQRPGSTIHQNRRRA